MKIEINNGTKPNEIDEDFVGLCVDRDGDIWLFGGYDAVCLGSYRVPCFLPKEAVLEAKFLGTFTKFNGSVTLEND